MKEEQRRKIEIRLLDMAGEVYQLGLNTLAVIELDNLSNAEKIKTVKGTIKQLNKIEEQLEEKDFKDFEQFKDLKESIKTVKTNLEINLGYLVEIAELEKLRDRLRAI